MKRIKTGVWVNRSFECNDTKTPEFNVWFDSKLELCVYMRIISLGIEVERQHSLLIKAPTNIFPARYWKVDFYLPGLDRYVEVKGHWVLQDSIYKSDFVKTIEMLEWCSTRNYERLMLVSDKGMRVGSLQFGTIEQMVQDLKFLRK